MKHVHILGISGTFMSSLAILARRLGYRVTGCDEHCYPPVSDLLAAQQIDWQEGYDDAELALQADHVIVGNVVKRGMPVIEVLLNQKRALWSGPQWLAEHVLPKYKVIAVSGTHGKTSTTAMVTHLFEQAGLKPGFLIGGVDNNLNTSARLGDGEWFIIEADEYDSAFFDKRPKLMHYRPDIAVINNLEFDHADIYRDLAAIQQQFQYYLRTIPSDSMLLTPYDDKAIQQVVETGVYCHHQTTSLLSHGDWYAVLKQASGECFDVYFNNNLMTSVSWPVVGEFNVQNALMAFATGYQAGIEPIVMANALAGFKPVKRRLQLLGTVNQICLYDDFAHHPTAIRKTIEAILQLERFKRVIAVVEIGSNTMKQGVHAKALKYALSFADNAILFSSNDMHIPELDIESDSDALIEQLLQKVASGDAVLFMSNKSFDGVQQRFKKKLERAML